jgi:hypothetical protein
MTRNSTFLASAQAAEATVNSATPSQEAQIAAVALGEPTEEHQQRSIGDRIAIEDPGQILERGIAKILRDVWQADIDDKQVEIGEADAHRYDRENLFRGSFRRARSRCDAGRRVDRFGFRPRHHALHSMCICIYCK